MIAPTVGRIVWYRPGDGDAVTMTIHGGGQPMAATVAYVWSDSCVNLSVTDHDGGVHKRTSVTLIEDGRDSPVTPYAEWMPYQKGQAAKTEALEKAAAR